MICRLTLCLLITLSLGCSREKIADDRPPEKIWRDACSTCHGTQGQGITMKLGRSIDMRTASWQAKYTDAQLVDIISRGKRGMKRMPAFSGRISDEQIQGMVSYIRGLGPGKE